MSVLEMGDGLMFICGVVMVSWYFPVEAFLPEALQENLDGNDSWREPTHDVEGACDG